MVYAYNSYNYNNALYTTYCTYKFTPAKHDSRTEFGKMINKIYEKEKSICEGKE